MNRLMMFLFALVPYLAVQAEDAPAGDDPWAHSISLGLQLTRGNSETLTGNAGLLSELKTQELEGALKLDGTYGETEEETTAENVVGSANFRKTLDQKFYGLGDINYRYDKIADIDYRVIGSLGAGVYLVRDETTTLGLEVGPAYLMEKVGDVSDDYMAFRIAERFEKKLSETARLWQTLEYIPKAEDWGQNITLVEIGTEAALNSHLNLRLVLKDAYDSEPADGNKKNDLTFIAGVTAKL